MNPFKSRRSRKFLKNKKRKFPTLENNGFSMLTILSFVCLVLLWWEASRIRNHLDDDDVPYDFVFLKSNPAGNWSAWDGESILFDDQGYQCKWRQYQTKMAPDDSVSVCLNPYNDTVSDTITVEDGFYKECDVVVKNWKASGGGILGLNQTYVDIGSHIGACIWTVLMALPKMVQVIAFEPHPRNLFCLTKTILRNPQWKDRVRLYPISVGDKVGKMKVDLHNDRDVGSTQLFVPKAGSAYSGVVFMETLDRLLLEKNRIDMMRINVNGNECLVMDGAAVMLRRTETVVVVLDSEDQHHYNNCTTPDVMKRFQRYELKPQWHRDRSSKYTFSGELLQKSTELTFVATRQSVI